jgi:hypothetical protein
MVSESTMKVTIPVKTAWKPGQYIFVRFLTLGLHALTTHPFTICSIPSVRPKTPSQLVFYIKARGGLTGRLARLAASSPGVVVPLLIDGPYGGLDSKALNHYDRSLVIACGSGAGLSLGFVMDWLVRQPRSGEQKDGVKLKRPSCRMQVIIATRDAQLLDWYEETLADFMKENGISFPASGLAISIYMTGGSRLNPRVEGDEQKSEDAVANKGAATESTHVLGPFEMFSGRPDINTIVHDMTGEPDVSVGVVVCGPKEVVKVTEDEAAAAQLRILRSSGGAREVYLHAERFS